MNDRIHVHTKSEEITGYTTKDGSVVKELIHPALHGNKTQSLAEASVAPGRRTIRHCHRLSEELYHVITGSGILTVGEEKMEVKAGHTVFIPAGEPHFIENSGQVDLKFLCIMSPPYSHDDTIILDQ